METRARQSAPSATPCPGCGLAALVPPGAAAYDGYFNTSTGCWLVFTDVCGREFGDVTLFSHAHQFTVDAYALQHAGGRHPDKSIALHLCGLHLTIARGVKPTAATRMKKAIADARPDWPHFEPPADTGPLTVQDVADADSVTAHIDTVRAWAEQVWRAWSRHHGAVRAMVDRHVDPG